MDEESSYVVNVWSHRSERSYTYGPFRYWDTVQAFCDKVDKTKGWEVGIISVLNSSKLFGTGNERSFE